MTAALQLSRLIGQLTPENIAILEAYAEFLLHRQAPAPTTEAEKTPTPSTNARLKTAMKFKGKAKYPKAATTKIEVYEQ
jgi:hypothetical protein